MKYATSNVMGNAQYCRSLIAHIAIRPSNNVRYMLCWVNCRMNAMHTALTYEVESAMHFMYTLVIVRVLAAHDDAPREYRKQSAYQAHHYTLPIG